MKKISVFGLVLLLFFLVGTVSVFGQITDSYYVDGYLIGYRHGELHPREQNLNIIIETGIKHAGLQLGSSQANDYERGFREGFRDARDGKSSAYQRPY